jgi:hypothetical protein
LLTTKDGRAARAGSEAWALAAQAEEEDWNKHAEAERRRLRAEAAKDSRQMELLARSNIGRGFRDRSERKQQPPQSSREEESKEKVEETEEERESRLRLSKEQEEITKARLLHDERMLRVRTLSQRRAMLLSRAPTIAVHPITSQTMYFLTGEQLKHALKKEAIRDAEIEANRRSGKPQLAGPKVGDRYRLPRLYEEVWLFEDADVDEPSDSDLIHMLVDMQTHTSKW